jgi:RNA polymerase sigma-70 factor, ECF subfamily
VVAEVADQLPDHHRDVFVLREMHGKTYEEIGELVGAKVGTVKSRLNRARTRFATIIEPMLN